MEISNSKKETFKLLIKEFHIEPFPATINRDLEVPLATKKIITIYGPRRSGKSFYFFTLIKKLIEQGIPKERLLYLNFEDDRILPLNFKELSLLLEAYYELYPENKKNEIYLFLDEIQNINSWEIFARRIYDKEKTKIFITGSSSKLLSKEIATSLRGRTISFGLFPLNFGEFLYFKGIKLNRNFEYTSLRFKIKKLLEEYLEWGGFPEIVLENSVKLKKKILSEYFDFLVYRDLIERFSLADSFLMKEILKYFFTNITSLFSVNSFCKIMQQNISVSRQTISDYLNFIQETNYFFFLPYFSYSLKVQKVNPRKIICLDNGLRNTISFRFSKDEGKLAENLIGTMLATKGESEIFYWKKKREIDFIVKQGREISAINVCYGEKIEQRQIFSLIDFKKSFKNVNNLIVITKDVEDEKDGIKFIPLWKWLLK